MVRNFFAVAVAIFLSAELYAGDWSQWRGSNRDLIVAGEELLERWPDGGPERLWLSEIPGEGYSAPIVVDGTLYITGSSGDKKSRKGHLYALDAASGKVKGEVEYGPEWGSSYEFARTTPTWHDGALYLVGGMGHVVCMSGKDGKILWKVDSHKEYGGRNITWGIADNPLIYDGKMICQPGGVDAAVVALDVKSGALVWRSKGLSERSAYCSPALLKINGRMQVVTMLEEHVVGLDAETGDHLWQHHHKNQHAVHPNTPVLCGENRIFVSSGYKHGAEILEIDGGEVKRIWHDKRHDNHFQGVALYQGRIFSSGGGRMSCFDPADGREVYNIAGAKKTTFCITPVGMITYDDNGGRVQLVKVTPESHEVVSSFKVDYGNGPHWSSPVVANGVLYLRRGKGVAAFRIGAR